MCRIMYSVTTCGKWLRAMIRTLFLGQAIARRSECHRQYVDAVRRGCTQDMHRAAKSLRAATTAVLKFETMGGLSWLAR